MKKNIIIAVIGLVLIIGGAVFHFVSKDDSTVKNTPKITESHDETEINSGTTLDANDVDITLTFDEGCMSDMYYYVDKEVVPETSLDWAMLEMQNFKCRVQEVDEGIYSSGVFTASQSNDSTTEINDDSAVYLYTYVYGSDIDYNSDVYVVLDSGEKIFASEYSEINENEGYLIFAVDSVSMAVSLIIEYDGNTIDLFNINPFACESGDCAF